MQSRARQLAYLIALATMLWLGTACEPAIGDQCETNLDCPPGAICDTTAPAGYCLISDCQDERDCPDGSLCVTFDRFTSYCMDGCNKDGDCRSAYTCRKDLDPRGFCYVERGDDLPFERSPGE